jgi:hypothetical protein
MKNLIFIEYYENIKSLHVIFTLTDMLKYYEMYHFISGL